MTEITKSLISVGISEGANDLVSILRAIASNKKNELGDLWSTDFCNDAADEIERLREEIIGMHEDAAGESI